jgi:N-acetylglucosamine kinase-like BadF-type ATPase
MILVADSGSSKTDWILQLANSQSIEFYTKGINPFLQSEKEIAKILQQSLEIQKFAAEISEVHFFGAGCTNPDKREIVSNALSRFLKNAFINVENDVLGRAYATCGKSKGLICILGTGSNIAFFDGSRIHECKQGLGYILGDEGSGTYFGKKLVTAYLYECMPKDLCKDFKETYSIDKETVIKSVYQKPSANLYLSSFARFLSKHKGHPYIDNLIREGFEEFIAINKKVFLDYRAFPCHFVGSIAFYFQDILKEVCSKHLIRIEKTLTHPIKELYNFISEAELQNI